MVSIFNLNIMHGRNRKSAIFPPKVGGDEIRSNLQEIADCILEHNPDFVTLQEIDQGSVLSGSFNQFEWLSEKLQYPYTHFAPSCQITLFGRNVFVSGNAIFSRYPLENKQSHAFNFSFPTDRMGFIVVAATLPNNKTITIVSLHLATLDWMRLNSRSHQLAMVEKVIASRDGVLIAGDFNCDFIGTEDSLRSFAKRLNLKVYEPDSKSLSTYPSWNPARRIDWVLGSTNNQFISYKILSTKLSDHLAIVATIST